MPISYKNKIYVPASDIQNIQKRTEHPVKSQIQINYNDANVAFDVLDYDKHELLDKDTTKTVCIGSHDVISTMQFCAPQLMYWTKNGLPAGNYKLTLNHAGCGGNQTYDGDYMFTLTKAIPADGGLRHTKPLGGWQASYVKSDILGKYITTYGSRPNRSVVEYGVVFSEYDGTTACTDLGTFTARHREYYVEDDLVNSGKRNFTEMQAWGSNRWRDSAFRQWLNSDAPARTSESVVSNWWTPQSVFDTVPNGASSAGFLHGLDPSIVSAIGEVKVITALCNCDRIDGATLDVTYDKVWLQSLTEVFGNKNNGISEGVQLAYWNSSTNTDRIKHYNGTAKSWRMRSPAIADPYIVQDVGTTGNLSYNSAADSLGAVPTFCIKQYDGIKPIVSYKRKIYTGKNITWNQLVDKSKFQNVSSLSGISVINTNDGSVMFDGTKTKSDAAFFSCGTYQITANHKYYLCGAPEGSGNGIYQLYSVFTPTGGSAVYSFDNGSGVFFSGQATASGSGNLNIIISQNTVSKIVFTPQLFDLTLMFGAGNESTTPAEFWSHFGRKYYPYNVGESQPLFLIGRKNKIKEG